MRFLRLVIILWLLITALIGSMTLYGRTTSDPGDLQGLGFGTCEGRPCYLDITPGVTKLPDAMASLAKHGGVLEAIGDQYSPAYLRAQYSIGELGVIMDYSPDTLIVWSLNIGLPGAAVVVKVGDVIRYWGLPCGFNRETMRYSRFGLEYPYLYLDLGYADKSINPDTWVHSIGITPHAVACDRDIPWHGFRLSAWYRNWK